MINSIFSSAVLLVLVVHYSLAFWSTFSRSTVFNVNFSFGVFKFCHILKILRNVKKSIWISLFWSTIYFFHILSSISFKYMLSKFSFQYDTLKRYLIGKNWLNWMNWLIVNWTNWVNFAVLDLILIAFVAGNNCRCPSRRVLKLFGEMQKFLQNHQKSRGLVPKVYD